MFLQNNKFVVPSGMHSTSLLKSHAKTPFDTQYTRQASANTAESLSKHHADNTSQANGNAGYNNSYPSQDYWNSQSKNQYFQNTKETRPFQSSNSFYYGDQPRKNSKGAVSQGNLYESNDAEEFRDARYNDSMRNQTNKLLSKVHNSNEMDQEIGCSASQKSNLEHNLVASTSNDLLRRASTHSNSSGPKSRSGAAKSRGNALYRNLNQLMDGKRSADAFNARPGSLKSRLIDEVKVQSKIPERNNLAELLKRSEMPKVSEVNSSKANSVYSSFAQFEQKICSKLKAEQIKIGEKKRMRRFWDSEKDTQLQNLIQIHNYDWEAIAQEFHDPEVTPEMVKERYENHLAPQISKARFSFKEDQIIAHYYATLGANWKKITAYLPGRTETMVRNRYYSAIKKKPIETFLNNGVDLANVSPHSSENKGIGHCSAENSASLDNLSEKYTGKYSDPEKNRSGSTAASFPQKKIESMSKNGEGLMNEELQNLNSQQSQFAVAATKTQKRNFTDAFEYNFESNQEMVKDQGFNDPGFTNGQLFGLESLQEDQKMPQRDDFSLGFAFGDEHANSKPLESGFFDPFGFDDFDLGKRETHDLIGFDKLSIFNGKIDCPDEGAANSIAQENPFESLLNFKEDKNILKGQENPLPSIGVSPLFVPQRNRKMSEELQNLFLDLSAQQNAQQQDQNNKPPLQPTAKFNQLESLLLQIKSIERLFDRTKQEINSLQTRFPPK